MISWQKNMKPLRDSIHIETHHRSTFLGCMAIAMGELAFKSIDSRLSNRLNSSELKIQYSMLEQLEGDRRDAA